jgi:transcriptional regulator with XRE-family HTH domain
LRLEAKRTDPRLPKELKTLGDHIRKKRIERGLFQRDVAALLDADTGSVNAWERNYHQPALRLLPAIIGFLNYNPDAITDEASVGRRIAVRRRALGISQQALAGLLGIDEGTLRGLERGRLPSTRRICDAIERWLAE